MCKLVGFDKATYGAVSHIIGWSRDPLPVPLTNTKGNTAWTWNHSITYFLKQLWRRCFITSASLVLHHFMLGWLKLNLILLCHLRWMMNECWWYLWLFIDAYHFWLSQTEPVTYMIQELVFSGCTVMPNSNRTKLGSR